MKLTSYCCPTRFVAGLAQKSTKSRGSFNVQADAAEKRERRLVTGNKECSPQVLLCITSYRAVYPQRRSAERPRARNSLDVLARFQNDGRRHVPCGDLTCSEHYRGRGEKLVAHPAIISEEAKQTIPAGPRTI